MERQGTDLRATESCIRCSARQNEAGGVRTYACASLFLSFTRLSCLLHTLLIFRFDLLLGCPTRPGRRNVQCTHSAFGLSLGATVEALGGAERRRARAIEWARFGVRTVSWEDAIGWLEWRRVEAGAIDSSNVQRPS